MDKEKIYEIPVNDAFDNDCTCPICKMRDTLEATEIDLITGASMMEPDIRIKTNEQGFCTKHYDMMLKTQNRLSLALTIQTHLDEVCKNIFDKKSFLSNPVKESDRISKYIKVLSDDCYVCNRIEFYMSKMIECLFLLFKTKPEFVNKIEKQPFFCLPHFKMLLERGSKSLNKKDFEKFYNIIMPIEEKYLNTLRDDIAWFCKKFDYRFAKEDWKNSKDSIERSIYILTSEKPKVEDK